MVCSNNVAKLIIKVDDYALPAGLLRHFDLTSTPTISRRESYPGGLLFVDRLLAVAEIDGKLETPLLMSKSHS